MIRTGHRVAAWAAATIILGCTGRERPESPPAVQQPAAQSPATAAPADATPPNRVLDPGLFADPTVRRAYAAAKLHADVLEKIYCYCHCRENIGHRALVECFESDHGAHCDVCMTEAITAARMTEQGKTPAEIQKAIDAFYAG